MTTPLRIVGNRTNEPQRDAQRSLLAETGLWLFLTAPLSFALVLGIATYLSRISF